MLEQILQQLQQNGTYSVSALARQLDVSEALVTQMLADLARLGYLRPVETGCEGTCQGCSQGKSCAPLRAARIWTTR